MKRLQLGVGAGLVVGLALLVGSGVAQEKSTKGRTLPTYWTRLGLSEDQKKKALEVRGEYRAKIAELEAKIKELKEAEDAELSKILTDEQKAKLRDLAAAKVTGAKPEKKDMKKDEKKPEPADKKPDEKKPDEKK